MTKKEKQYLYGGGGVLVLVVGSYFYGKWQKENYERKLKEELEKAGGATYTLPGGTPINLFDKVTQIADNLGTSYSWWNPQNWTENDQAVIDVLQTIPKEYMPEVQLMYLDRYERNLRSDLVELLDGNMWNEVSYLFT